MEYVRVLFDLFSKYDLQFRFICGMLAMLGFVCLGIYYACAYLKYKIDVGEETIRSLVFKFSWSVFSGLIVFIMITFPISLLLSKFLSSVIGGIVLIIFVWFIPKDWMTL